MTWLMLSTSRPRAATSVATSTRRPPRRSACSRTCRTATSRWHMCGIAWTWITQRRLRRSTPYSPRDRAIPLRCTGRPCPCVAWGGLRKPSRRWSLARVSSFSSCAIWDIQSNLRHIRPIVVLFFFLRKHTEGLLKIRLIQLQIYKNLLKKYNSILQTHLDNQHTFAAFLLNLKNAWGKNIDLRR